MCVCSTPVTVYFRCFPYPVRNLNSRSIVSVTTLLGGLNWCRVQTGEGSSTYPSTEGSAEAATWLCLLQASSCVRDARGNIGWLAITGGVGFLASASCTAERRLLASDMLYLSCLMTN